MEDRDDRDLGSLFVNSIDDDVWVLDQFTGSCDSPWASHMCKTVELEKADTVTDARDHVGCGGRVILGYPRVNTAWSSSAS